MNRNMDGGYSGEPFFNESSNSWTLNMSFPRNPRNSRMQDALNITYILIACCGVLGNLTTLIVIFTHAPIRRKLPNYYFINQTIVDFILSILLAPSMTINLIPIGYSTTLLCLLWQCRITFISLYDVSTYCILALSVERYLEIVHPIWHKLHVTKAKVIITIILVWLFGLLIQFSYVLSTTRAVNGTCRVVSFFPSRAVSSFAGVLNFLIEFIFPLLIISFCYVQMWRCLQSKVKPLSGPNDAVSGNTSGPLISLSRARRNILKTLFIIVASFMICNTHKQILLLLHFLNILPLDVFALNFNVSQILSYVNATVDPYIYLIFHKEFQIGLRKLFKRGARSKRGDNSTIRSNDKTEMSGSIAP